MTRKQAKPARLRYQPSGRMLDVEIFPFDDLRHRGTPEQILAAHRYAFYMLVCVTAGVVTQLVDFEPVVCKSGSLLVIRPGQVHSFGSGKGWEGWLIVFRAEFLPSDSEKTSDLIAALGLNRLPNQLVLSAEDFDAVSQSMVQMHRDAAVEAPPKNVHALLRHQLSALLMRLAIIQDQLEESRTATNRGLKRYAKFYKLIEQNYSRWHQVADYAHALGCTEKSLTRAAMEATGRSAKEEISARITLEAKRLLKHTDTSVYLIASSLGFDEATNFSKFFRREAGCTPGQFRKHE
jgi:AraC-like DNA-binding protein